MNPLPECCFPHSAPIPHQFVMKVYVDAWIYVTEKFVNMGNIELYEGVLRYEKVDYPPDLLFIILTYRGWHPRCPGTVETVPYRTFYDVQPASKQSVGRGPSPRRGETFAGCGKRCKQFVGDDASSRQ